MSYLDDMPSHISLRSANISSDADAEVYRHRKSARTFSMKAFDWDQYQNTSQNELREFIECFGNHHFSNVGEEAQLARTFNSTGGAWPESEVSFPQLELSGLSSLLAWNQPNQLLSNRSLNHSRGLSIERPNLLPVKEVLPEKDRSEGEHEGTGSQDQIPKESDKNTAPNQAPIHQTSTELNQKSGLSMNGAVGSKVKKYYSQYVPIGLSPNNNQLKVDNNKKRDASFSGVIGDRKVTGFSQKISIDEHQEQHLAVGLKLDNNDATEELNPYLEGDHVSADSGTVGPNTNRILEH